MRFSIWHIKRQKKKQRQKYRGHWHRRSSRTGANYLQWSVKEHLIAGSEKKKSFHVAGERTVDNNR